MTKKVKLFIFIFGLGVLALGANFALAQADFGTAQVSSTINLAAGDPLVIIGRIIQIALSFLGIIALLLIMYAGFLWMSSGGDEDKITSAKQILKNTVIGLVIILSSWAITTFVLSKLVAAIGGGGATGPAVSGYSALSGAGLGAIGACTVEDFYPEAGQTDVARNSSIIITFKEPVKADTVCVNAAGDACACNNTETEKCNKINPENIKIYKTDLGDACASGSCPEINANVTDVNVSLSSDRKTLIFTPLSYLGNSTSNIWYSVKITSDLKKTDDSSMFKDCDENYFVWKFEVSTKLDLTPPQVVFGNTFPLPDNEGDVENKVAEAIAAQGFITVSAVPNIYQAASITSVESITSADSIASPIATATPLNYQGSLTKFTVKIPMASTDKAQLFDGNNDTNLLGLADFDAAGNAKFAGYFIFNVSERSSGNSWLVNMIPEQMADTLTIGNEVYTFSDTASGGNNIKIDPEGSFPVIVDKIYNTLSGDTSLDVLRGAGTKINLTAKVAGANGNNIEVSTTNPTAFKITPLSGGSDRQSLAETKDKKDVPMNTVIQLSFNEAVNPSKVAGLASEVSEYIKVVNYDVSSLSGGAACTKNSDCQSYKCEDTAGAKICVGNYVNGRFLVSNAYRTVEFVSDNECGVNGCGEKIYCLPADSHLAVKLKTADLKACSSDTDCAAFSPFKTCTATVLGYKTCQDVDNKNYPLATGSLNGIIDIALNSFDGDRNVVSDGPLDFYDENYSPEANINKKDSYRFSFYVNDTINLTSPKIESVTPTQGSYGINLAAPIKIIWDTLMMNSSLATGGRSVNNGSTTIEHKLINLRSLTDSAIGYWVTNDNIDSTSTQNLLLDGEPDQTISWIKHTAFAESMSYRTQAGSGIRNIYQNCYKPSGGDNCPVSDTSPSCCQGVATSVLGPDGNCQ